MSHNLQQALQVSRLAGADHDAALMPHVSRTLEYVPLVHLIPTQWTATRSGQQRGTHPRDTLTITALTCFRTTATADVNTDDANCSTIEVTSAAAGPHIYTHTDPEHGGSGQVNVVWVWQSSGIAVISLDCQTAPSEFAFLQGHAISPPLCSDPTMCPPGGTWPHTAMPRMHKLTTSQ